MLKVTGANLGPYEAWLVLRGIKTHSSHRALPPQERARIGIGDGLVRLSVGIEALEDILGDLEQALYSWSL